MYFRKSDRTNSELIKRIKRNYRNSSIGQIKHMYNLSDLCYYFLYMKPIRKIKTKYYSKEIIKYLLLAGAVTIAAYSPYFARNLTKIIFRDRKLPKKDKKKIIGSFYYLKKKNLIELKRNGYDVRIALTQEGRKKAGKYQIDDLYLERPKKWDKKWRVIIFDIPNSKNIIRDIFRRKLKEFEFYPLQKSIWVYPFPCREEIEFLREFLDVTKKQIQVLEVIELEDDGYLRRIFHL